MRVTTTIGLVLAAATLSASGCTGQSDRYAQFSDNPLPARQGDNVLFGGDYPALQVGFWSVDPSGDLAASMEANLTRQGSSVVKEQSTAIVTLYAPPKPATHHRLSRISLTVRGSAVEKANAWSDIIVTITELAPPFGCGSLVAAYRIDHWHGWAREFHGCPLPWKANRLSRLVTTREVRLVETALTGRFLKGPVIGGGPHEPLEHPEFRHAVQRLASTGCSLPEGQAETGS